MTAVRGLALGPARWTQRPRFDLDALTAGDDEGARLDAALRRHAGAARGRRGAGSRGRGRDLRGAGAAARRRARSSRPRAPRSRPASRRRARSGRRADEVAAAFDGVDDAYLRARAIDVRDVADRVLLELARARGARRRPSRGSSSPTSSRPARSRSSTRPSRTGSSPPAAARSTTPRSSPGRSASRCSSASAPRCSQSPRAPRSRIDGEARSPSSPTPPPRRRSSERREAEAAARAEALSAAAEPVTLADGRRIEVFANIGNADDARLAVEQGAEGVGLLRTEFLFHDRATPPSEDEQVAALTEIAERLAGPPADRAHARRRRRQAAAVRRARARGQPVPRQARHPACRWSSPSCSPPSCARSCAWPPSTRCR